MNTPKCHPVMFWIHGGAFSFGSGSDAMYGPDFLIEQNLLVVTINYRLGPIGINFIIFQSPNIFLSIYTYKTIS